MTVLRRSLLFRLWGLISILWLALVAWRVIILYPNLPVDPSLPVLAFLPPTILFIVSAGPIWFWKWFGATLPEHLRRGLLRIYIVISAPWVAWYGYQIYDFIQRHHYWRWRNISHAFWSLLIAPVGGPILLLAIVWVLAGFRKSTSSSNERPAQGSNTPSRETPILPEIGREASTKVPPNFFEIGRTMAIALMNPDDCWRDVCKLREYKAPGPVATCETAFARAAVIKDAIRKGNADQNAAAMLAGVDKLVAEAFANEDTEETLKYYGNKRLSVVGPQAVRYYEQNVFPLTQLADAFAHRLSIPGFPNVEIAPLFEKVAVEAEHLIKVSSAVQKLKH
jgi:hypothetical protein